MAGLRGQNMKPRQPSSASLSSLAPLARIAVIENLCCRHSFDFFLQQQTHIGQIGKRLRNRELCLGAEPCLLGLLLALIYGWWRDQVLERRPSATGMPAPAPDPTYGN